MLAVITQHWSTVVMGWGVKALASIGLAALIMLSGLSATCQKERNPLASARPLDAVVVAQRATTGPDGRKTLFVSSLPMSTIVDGYRDAALKLRGRQVPGGGLGGGRFEVNDACLTISAWGSEVTNPGYFPGLTSEDMARLSNATGFVEIEWSDCSYRG